MRVAYQGLGRLFLCLIIALRSNGITKSKASNTQADNGYKKFRCKHKHKPPQKISRNGFLCKHRL